MLAGFLGAYLAATLAFVAFSIVLPAPALVVFVLVSLVHFGTADIAYNRWRRGSTGPDDSADLIVQTIAYGGRSPGCPRWSSSDGTAAPARLVGTPRESAR